MRGSVCEREKESDNANVNVRNNDRPGKRCGEAGCTLKWHQHQVHCLPSKGQFCHQVQLQHLSQGNCSRCWWYRPWTTAQNIKTQMVVKRKRKRKSKGENEIHHADHLNSDIAFPDIEILQVDLLAPFLFPIEAGSNIRPKPRGVLDGPLIHLQILTRTMMINW